MDMQTYKLRRQQLLAEEPRYRRLCATCIQPDQLCYCAHVQVFDPKIQFVILIHPMEVRRRIATGRMSHLCMKGSHLIDGHDYSDNPRVNALLEDPQNHCVMLYPGLHSLNITGMETSARAKLFPTDKRLTVFVIDGTWATARKMVRLSQNLRSLQRICFVPTRESNFRVRKQPRAGCVSTLEAIHHTIELLGDAHGFDVASGEHDKLLHAFDYMVEQQLRFVREAASRPGGSRYRRQRLTEV